MCPPCGDFLLVMLRYTSYEPYIQRLAGRVIELSIQGADASWIILYKRLLLERDNCSIIFLVDEVLDLIRFEYIYQCFHTFVILIASSSIFTLCGFSAISFTVAVRPAPSFRVMIPLSCRRSSARASLVVSFGTAMVSPSAISSRLALVPG